MILQFYIMDDIETQKTISLAITTELGQYLNLQRSKLAELQQFYKSKIGNNEILISENGKLLTKNRFGASINCMKRNPNHKQFAFSANLVCFAEVLLRAAFQDKYVLAILLKELQQNNCQHFAKMLKCFNPFKTLKFTAEDIQIILIQILIKLNSKRTTETLYNILKSYPLAAEMYSILLRMELLKQNHIKSENMCEELKNTNEIYDILGEKFGINGNMNKISSLKKRNHSDNPTQIKLGDKARVYLVDEFNLFISTPDNEEFCCGKFYSNEEDMLKGEKQIRKSVLDYLRMCQEAFQKQVSEDNEENQEKLDSMRPLALDLGMSGSGFMYMNPNSDTPCFNNSNPDTPQFNSIADSNRFKKSLDFQSATKMAEKSKRNNNLGTVEEQIFSPASDGNEKFNFGKNSSAKLFYGEQKLNDSVHFDQQQIPSFKIKEESSNMEKDQESNKVNILPPLILSKWEINTTQGIKKQLKIPVMGKKSLMTNSDMKSQFKFEVAQYEKQIKQLSSVVYKQSHKFPKIQQAPKKQQIKRKRQSRKYSINETSSLIKRKEKDYVHYSNLFNNVEDQQTQKDQKGENSVSPKRFIGKNIAWEDKQSDNLSVSRRKASKKMQIISKAVDEKFSTKLRKNKQNQFFSKSRTPDHKAKTKQLDPNMTKNNFNKWYQQWKELKMHQLKKNDSEKKIINSKSPETNKLTRTFTLKQEIGNNNFKEKIDVSKIQQHVNSKKSPRSVKNSNFPQFLKNSKNRKNLAQENKDVPNGHNGKQQRKFLYSKNENPRYNLPEKFKDYQVIQSKCMKSQYACSPKNYEVRPANQQFTKKCQDQYIPVQNNNQAIPIFKKNTQRKHISSDGDLNVVFQTYPIYEASQIQNTNKPRESYQSPSMVTKNVNQNVHQQFSHPINVQQQVFVAREKDYSNRSPLQSNYVKNNDYFARKHEFSGYNQVSHQQVQQGYQSLQPGTRPFMYQSQQQAQAPTQIASTNFPKTVKIDHNLQMQQQRERDRDRERERIQTLVNSKMMSTRAETVYAEQACWRTDGFRFIANEDTNKNWRFL